MMVMMLNTMIMFKNFYNVRVHKYVLWVLFSPWLDLYVHEFIYERFECFCKVRISLPTLICNEMVSLGYYGRQFKLQETGAWFDLQKPSVRGRFRSWS